MDEIERPVLSEKLVRRAMRFSLDKRIQMAASDVLSRNHSNLDDIDHYLDVLDSPVGRQLQDRLVAVEALQYAELSPEQAARAETVANNILSQTHTEPLVTFASRAFNAVCRYAAVIFLLSLFVKLAVLVFGVNSNNAASVDAGFWSLVILLAVPIPTLSISLDEAKYRRLREACAALLGRIGGPPSIETLLSTTDDPQLWTQAGPALFRVLTRLTADDYGRVSLRGVKLLSNALHPFVLKNDLDVWVPLILESLDKVGTGAYAAEVHNIAVNSPVKEWREHASRILPTLHARRRMERDAALLLRATESTAQQASLLRPAAAGRIESGNLLQPSDQPSVAVKSQTRP